MAFYIGNGTFFVRKDEAKKVDKDYIEVEVPSKQGELCDFLNKLVASVKAEAVETQAPQFIAEPGDEMTLTAKVVTSKTIDDVFICLPLAHKLTLAGIALEDARGLLPHMAATGAAKVDPQESVAEIVVETEPVVQDADDLI